MSNDEQHGNPGGWEPIPQSEGYDGDATAFVQLPPDFMLDGVPLEAPGHSYVPPMIMPLQPLTPAAADPSATGTWSVHTPTEAEQVQHFDDYGHDQGQSQGQGTEYFEQGEYVQHVEHVGHVQHFEHAEHAEGFGQDPHATAEWNFAGGAGSTGQWEIPVAAPEASAPEALVPETVAPEAAEPPLPPSYDQAPATLPGGAPAPWALPEEPAFEEPAAEEPVAEERVAEEEAPAEAPADISADAPADAVEIPADAAEVPAEGIDAAAPGAAPVTVPAPGAYASTDSDEHPHTSYTLRVNGTDRPVTGSWIGESLLYVLRERLGLAGAKDGCSQGECGACNVKVDGRLVASCLVPAATAAGSEVRTVEGLATDGEPSDVQRAMSKCGTVQCGFCIPGMCMTVHDLLEGNHAPTELETRQALAGNLCRCSGYRGVLEAVRDVVAEREASAAATATTGPEAAEPRVPHQIPHAHDGGMA
ncbi:Xanthine dehydrogenase iron-sulfur subunit [Streptomyces venezuelae]|uniref:(2Fe-2S)-binding protein n=1 Tax=Streptomyces gardneri TaxID=66892 RepID=UPI0006BC1585|nr:(2Fe-2S)-binding protein [Streptomyces gardneri]ALO08749.1 Xanthine dehydrogenase iron-sulfur subunit [Streptomyces venezuelae]QPK45933.1 (2Fe-2S)-binding protein [Streptomyces gardneri]WRK37284.1 (2Fe-2S)-binding protein [Streptomyces venezuelae]CUM40872.1 Xanthine dehydrogenase iron-sulfur subunit [Streptomyces venezuelae]